MSIAEMKAKYAALQNQIAAALGDQAKFKPLAEAAKKLHAQIVAAESGRASGF